ncbi:MAG TPA: hypothetical protein VHT26_06880 [Trebonia sp.]|jgi:hypothetical protein|nr:hypothetical protein [Trebonia sp.]
MSDDTRAAGPEDPTTRPVGEPLSIANEFTGVVIRKVLTRNGERLELTVPKSGYRTLLDAMQLEIISTLSPEAFTEMFARRLGSYEAPGAEERS